MGGPGFWLIVGIAALITSCAVAMLREWHTEAEAKRAMWARQAREDSGDADTERLAVADECRGDFTATPIHDELAVERLRAGLEAWGKR